MEPFVKAQLTIKASKERVWDALTNPDITEKYMYGCRVVTNWRPGSVIDWVGQVDGKEVVFVRGRVIKCEPCSALTYTVIDPLAKYPLIPENHLTVTCTLSETESGETEITVTQGDYSKVADGANRYAHGGDGWTELLQVIKQLVEAG